jgi:hypothetical protein
VSLAEIKTLLSHGGLIRKKEALEPIHLEKISILSSS